MQSKHYDFLHMTNATALKEENCAELLPYMEIWREFTH